MVSVFVTGSSAGIGQQTAWELATAGHRVVLHARNDERAAAALTAVPNAAGVVVGDVSRQEALLAAAARLTKATLPD